ncbi:MAG: hypothetical protein JW834_04135 [Candidatus Diapherotrites archaeon]|nr:hypothetical protein [Candidatus Diapherotrites archaeon]
MIGSKGQEEAPFSMLLAVAMLAMVLPIAMFLFSTFQDWQCEQEVQNNLQSLARDLELAATLGGGERTIEVDLTKSLCGDFRVDNFTLLAPGEDQCIDYCHDPNCRILRGTYIDYSERDEAGNPEVQLATQDVCVRIPSNVRFVTTGCAAGGGGELFDIGEDIRPGYHIFKIKKEGFEVRLCEYKRAEER